MNRDIVVVIVSWNVCALLERCLASLAPLGCRTIVVDNASADASAAMVRQVFPAVELIEAGSNRGFAGGNNLALRRLLDDAEPPRAVLLLNPDTEVSAGQLPALWQALDAHPEVDVVGPQLRYADGSLQSSCRRLPQRRTYLWESTPLEQLWPGNPWARRYRMADADPQQPRAVEWLVGAALLVRFSAIARAGVFDEGFALYSEELEWQRRLAAGGRVIWYLPSVVVTHHEGKSSEQAPARRRLLFRQSRLRDAAMQFGMPFAQVLRLALMSFSAAELGIEAAKWLAGHRRALRAARVHEHWDVLCGLARHQPTR